MAGAEGGLTTCDHAINTKGTGAHTGRVSGNPAKPETCDHAINTKGTGTTSGRRGYEYYQVQSTLRFRDDPYVEDAVRKFAVTLDPDSDGDMAPESGELHVTCAKGAPTDVMFVKKHIGNVKYEEKYSSPINVTMGKVSMRNASGNAEPDGITVAAAPELARLCRKLSQATP